MESKSISEPGALDKLGQTPTTQNTTTPRILDYSLFPKPVSYWTFRGKAFEPAHKMRNSVRPIEKVLFDGIRRAPASAKN